MTLGPHQEVLLLSASPAAHAVQIRELELRGFRVRVARTPHRALRLLARRPVLALVDLAQSTGVTAEVVAALNGARDRLTVLVLHAGSLAADSHAVSALSVDGFYRVDTADPTEQFASSSRVTGTSLLH